MECPDLLLLAVICCFTGALVFGESAYNMYKAWKLKRAFKLREKADRRRIQRADRT